MSNITAHRNDTVGSLSFVVRRRGLAASEAWDCQAANRRWCCVAAGSAGATPGKTGMGDQCGGGHAGRLLAGKGYSARAPLRSGDMNAEKADVSLLRRGDSSPFRSPRGDCTPTPHHHALTRGWPPPRASHEPWITKSHTLNRIFYLAHVTNTCIVDEHHLKILFAEGCKGSAKALNR